VHIQISKRGDCHKDIGMKIVLMFAEINCGHGTRL